MSIVKEISTKNKRVLEEFLLSIEDYSQEGIFRCSESEEILCANNAFIKMFDYEDVEDLRVITFGQLFAIDEVRILLRDRVKAEGIVVNQRALFRKKNGKNFWGMFTSKQVIQKDQIIIDTRVHDISELVKTEQLLKESEIRHERVTAELDRFIYSASHDIRSPVSTILGLINLMKLDFKDHVAIKYIHMIEKSISKLDYFVNELTTHAKISKSLVKDEQVLFRPLVNEIMDDFKRNHPLFDKLIWSVEVNDLFPFYSDAERLRVILYNTIKNSLDYSDQKKSNKIVSVQVLTEPDKALVQIFDNGIGIATAHVGYVFNMFYRATDMSKGAGLGLYTVRESVTKLGGIITLNSEYGLGTSIKMEFPNSKKGKLINKKNKMKFLHSNTP